MEEIQSIHSQEDLARILNQDQIVVVFKHSTRCPISATALEEFQAFAAEEKNCKLVYVDVIASRPLSNSIAEISGVQHQSPQILVFKDGKVLWHASHSAITAQRISEEVLT